MTPYTPEEVTTMINALVKVSQDRLETDNVLLNLLNDLVLRLLILEEKESKREAEKEADRATLVNYFNSMD